MKTAATVLQELMVSLENTPEYECISQTGPQHCSIFEFKCFAYGHTVTAMARTKKEAKQEAARLMLLQLSRSGLAVPPPYGSLEAQVPSTSAQLPSTSTSCRTPPPNQLHGSRSYVALLKELCEEFRLPAPEFELASDTGPAHERRFAMRARVGRHERLAVAGTKKMAKQRAAELVYGYLRLNLARLTRDFVEEDALVRATAKAMEKYTEVRKDIPWRPNLSQKISEYHLAFKDIEEERRAPPPPSPPTTCCWRCDSEHLPHLPTTRGPDLFNCVSTDTDYLCLHPRIRIRIRTSTFVLPLFIRIQLLFIIF